MLTGRDDGHKLLPFVILPRKRSIADIEKKFKGKLHLIWAGKIWMDNKLTEKYLKCIFGNGPSVFGKRLLIWDAFRCHLSDETKKVLKRIDVENAIIPGGCTKFIQVL